jgi:flagellar export protein FliJ
VNYRERLERLQEIELGKAHQSRNERAAALAAVTREKTSYLDSRHDEGVLDVVQLIANEAYSARLDRLHSARSAALRYSDQIVETEREILLARSRDRKAMERLLERRIEDERLLARRAETISLDEIAISRWKPPDHIQPVSPQRKEAPIEPPRR